MEKPPLAMCALKSERREFAMIIIDSVRPGVAESAALVRAGRAQETVGHVLASAGKKDRAISILSELQEQKKTGYSSCFRIAQIYACLSDREAALKMLEQAVDEKDPFLWYLGVDPIFRFRCNSAPLKTL
jgi:hypothetical protein